MYKFIFLWKWLITTLNKTIFGPLGYSKSLIFETINQINPRLNLATMLIFEDEIRMKSSLLVEWTPMNAQIRIYLVR